MPTPWTCGFCATADRSPVPEPTPDQSCRCTICHPSEHPEYGRSSHPHVSEVPQVGTASPCDCAHDLSTIAAIKQARRNFGSTLPDGVVLLGSGVARITYALPCGKHVVKLDAHDGYSMQSESEVKTWLTLKDNPKAWDALMPIREYSLKDGWIVMDRAPTTLRELFGGGYDCPGCAWSRQPNCQHEVHKWAVKQDEFRVYMKHEFDIEDMHSGNIGIVGEKLVAFDYGFA